MKKSLLLEPTTLHSLTLRNRIVMAPMTTWAGNEDGTVSAEEEAYYRARVKDVGLVITGCTHVQANGKGFSDEFAAYDDRFIPSLRRLAAAAKSGGAPAILQIFHAGVKTKPELVSNIVAASAVPGGAGLSVVTPRALSDDEVLDVIQAFGAATRRAIEAGFDGVELHGAHAFLLQNFYSPHSNRRTDQWGGSCDNRARFPLAVVDEVRRTIAQYAQRPFILGYRISPDEPYEGGLRIADSLSLVDKLIDAHIDYLHVSLGNVFEAKPVDGAQGPTIIELVRERLAGRIPLVAAGRIRTPEQAERAIRAGLTLVAVGQGLVMNPNWAAVARGEEGGVVALDLAESDVSQLDIPPKLWKAIESAGDWFNLRRPA